MLKGRIKQSIVFWCFNARGEKWDAEKTCTVAKELGVPALEVIGPEHWPTMKKHGLICALAPNGMPGAPFMRGLPSRTRHSTLRDECGYRFLTCRL